MSELYQHYKGGIYRYIQLAKLESTGEMMVLYESFQDGTCYIRPFNEWAVKFKKLEPKKSIDSDLPIKHIERFITEGYGDR